MTLLQLPFCARGQTFSTRVQHLFAWKGCLRPAAHIGSVQPLSSWVTRSPVVCSCVAFVYSNPRVWESCCHTFGVISIQLASGTSCNPFPSGVGDGSQDFSSAPQQSGQTHLLQEYSVQLIGITGKPNTKGRSCCHRASSTSFFIKDISLFHLKRTLAPEN